MDSFWGNVFEYFKDRRVAGVFYRTLFALLLLLIGGALLRPILWCVLTIAGAIFLMWLIRAFCRARARWRHRYKSSPLSRDELKKARSKLIRVKQ